MFVKILQIFKVIQKIKIWWRIIFENIGFIVVIIIVVIIVVIIIIVVIVVIIVIIAVISLVSFSVFIGIFPI